MTTSNETTELSTETLAQSNAQDNSAARDGENVNLPALPDAFGEESLLKMFESIKKEVDSEVPDVESEDGRKRIKSLAAKISKSKTALDTPMRDFLRILKTQPKILETNARKSKERFDKLRDDLLAPLSAAQAWQDEQLTSLNGIPAWCATNPISYEIFECINNISAFDITAVWPELKKKFKVAHEAAMTTLKVTLERIELAEQQAAKLAELEVKQAKAEQDDRDRLIAESATKKAQAAAEAKAKKDHEDIQRRAVESKQREEASKVAEAKAIRNAEIAEENRIKDAENAQAAAEQAKINAEARQAAVVEKAATDEARRIADEEAEHEKLAIARAENKENRAKKHRAALVAMIGLGVSDEMARIVILAIRDGKIPSFSIQY